MDGSEHQSFAKPKAHRADCVARAAAPGRRNGGTRTRVAPCARAMTAVVVGTVRACTHATIPYSLRSAAAYVLLTFRSLSWHAVRSRKPERQEWKASRRKSVEAVPALLANHLQLYQGEAM